MSTSHLLVREHLRIEPAAALDAPNAWCVLQDIQDSLGNPTSAALMITCQHCQDPMLSRIGPTCRHRMFPTNRRKRRNTEAGRGRRRGNVNSGFGREGRPDMPLLYREQTRWEASDFSGSIRGVGVQGSASSASVQRGDSQIVSCEVNACSSARAT